MTNTGVAKKIQDLMLTSVAEQVGLGLTRTFFHI